MSRILKMFRKGQNCQAIKCITWQYGSRCWPFLYLYYLLLMAWVRDFERHGMGKILRMIIKG